MKLTAEQETVCRVFGRRDKTGHVHCKECPMELDTRDCVCLKAITREHATEDYDWNGSPYPGLGEYDTERDS